jgi:hypothetical protein
MVLNSRSSTNKGECLYPNLSAEIAMVEPNAPQGGMMANRHEGWDFPCRVPQATARLTARACLPVIQRG